MRRIQMTQNIVLIYLFYLDKLIYNLGAQGPRLIQSMMTKSEAQMMALHDDMNASVIVDEGDYYAVERSSVTSSSLAAVATLFQKGEGVFIETQFNPLSFPNTEGVVISGCSGLFSHIVASLEDHGPSLFAAAVYMATNNYLEQGLPGSRSLGITPMLAFNRMTELANEHLT